MDSRVESSQSCVALVAKIFGGKLPRTGAGPRPLNPRASRVEIGAGYGRASGLAPKRTHGVLKRPACRPDICIVTPVSERVASAPEGCCGLRARTWAATQLCWVRIQSEALASKRRRPPTLEKDGALRRRLNGLCPKGDSEVRPPGLPHLVLSPIQHR